MNLQPSTFDYSVVPADVAAEARAVAERVRSRMRRQVSEIIETGRDLIAMKERLGHGNFLPWVAAEFGMSDQSARNFMHATEAFGKSKTVLNLPPKVVYELAAPKTPEPIREEIVQRLEAGEELPPAAILDRVREAREAAEREQREAKITPQERKREQRNEALRLKRWEAKQAEEEAYLVKQRAFRQEAAERAARWLAARLDLNELAELPLLLSHVVTQDLVAAIEAIVPPQNEAGAPPDTDAPAIPGPAAGGAVVAAPEPDDLEIPDYLRRSFAREAAQ